MGTPGATKVSELEFHPSGKPGVDARVDNVAKAILDDVALRMRSDPDLRAVIVGMATAGESARTAAQRAVNTKHYLAHDAGIDPQRIEARTGGRSAMSAEIWMVPAGAPLDLKTTKPVDERRIRGASRAR